MTFSTFERMFDGDVFSIMTIIIYNIVRTGDNTYDIEVALAGFGKKDIHVEYAENTLTIKSNRDEDKESKMELSQGIPKTIYKALQLQMM